MPGLASCITSAVLKLQNISVSVWKNHSNTPSTGSAVALIIGRQLGSTTFSSVYRFTGSALEFTRWLSDSCIHIRLSAGVPSFNTSLVLSLPGHLAAAKGSLLSVLMYDLPNPLIASSQRFSGISLLGSSFGTYLAVVPRTRGCSAALLQPNTDSIVCSSSDLDTREAGVTVAEAAVSVAFLDPLLRLDNVIVSLMSPSGRQFKLMQNKCFGAIPCSGGVAFRFQILPIVQLLGVPLQVCPSSGQYLPDDVISLRLELLSPSARGTWGLRVATGTQILNVSSASFFFKTAILDVRFSSASVTSLDWFSDSSLSMKAPGYQNASGTESSSGWGRNHTVAAFSSGMQSPSSCRYSYPDPVVADTNAGASYSSSGSFKLQLLGRYFSNANSDPRVRAEYSTCAATRWSSDTAVFCTQAPSLGHMRALVLTLERSAVANFNITSNFFHEQVVSGSSAHALSSTAASSVTLFGAGFGVRSDTPRLRVWGVLSSAVASKWLCDTLVLTKVAFSKPNTPGLTISIASVARNFTALKLPELWPPYITAWKNVNFPTTGAALFQLTGSAFGLRMESMQTSFGASASPASTWISDSAAVCKSSSGFKSTRPMLCLSLSMMFSSFAAGFTFAEPVTTQVNFTNLSTPSLVLRGNSYSTFDAKPRISIDSNTIDAFWTSDSAMTLRLYSLPISRDLVTLRVYFFTNTSDSNSTLLANNFVANPLFVPSSKPVAQSLNCVMYIHVPDAVLNAFSTYVQNGFSSVGQIFQAQNQSDLLIFQFSELIDIDVVVFNNHSQVYLYNYVPIEVYISGNVSVINEQTGDVISSIICYGSTQVSAVLPSNNFAVMFRFSVALCSPADISAVRFRYDFFALNEVGTPLSFYAQSASFSVKRLPVFSLILSQFPLSNATPASTVLSPLEITLSSSIDYCSRLYFSSELSLSCAAAFENVKKASPFYGSGDTCSNVHREVNSLKQTTLGTCSTRFLLSFGPAGKCEMKFSVPAMSLTLSLPHFTIMHGSAADFIVIGELKSAIRGGGLLQSINISGMNCLCIRLFDGCNNTFTSHEFIVELSARLSNFSPYSLLGQVFSNPNYDGIAQWCSARVSLAVSMLVQVQVSIQSFQKPLPILFNVSGAGEPVALSTPPVMPLNLSAAGRSLAPMTFKLQDAAGVPTYQSNVAVRVRVVVKSSIRCGDESPLFY